MKQLKHLPRYLSPQEKTAVKALLVILAISILAVGSKFLSSHIQRVPSNGGDYSEATVGSPHSVNPLFAANNDVDLDLVKLIFSGLIKITANGELIPDLASSYDISNDGKIYTIHLKDNVHWHDGKPFSSKDVVATISFIKDPAWKSPLFMQFKNVNVDAPDEKTVRFTLPEPFAPFLSLLTVGILPEHLWQDVKPENATRAELNIKPIGTGPYHFKSFTKDKKGAILSYTLLRNSDFYDAPAHLASITFKFYSDFTTARDALLTHKADGLSFLPQELRGDVEKMQTVTLSMLHLPQYTAVFFNQKKNTGLQSKNVRQALAFAINREKILKEIIHENGILVNSPILAGFIGFNPDIKKYTYSTSRANELLEKDGWRIDTDGGRKKEITTGSGKKATTTKISLTLTLTTVDTKENIAVAQFIKQSWDALGVKTELEIVPASKIQKEKIKTRDYDAMLYGEIIGPDPDPYPFWHSSQSDSSGLNLSLYANSRVDELLEKARATNKKEERTSLYQDFQNILTDDVPAIFLYSPSYLSVMSKKIKGAEQGIIFTPADRLNTVTNWYIDTKHIWK